MGWHTIKRQQKYKGLSVHVGHPLAVEERAWAGVSHLSNSEGDGLPQLYGFFHLSLCLVLAELTKVIPLLKCGGAAGGRKY